MLMNDKRGGNEMQQYQFERIYSQMEKEFGKIRIGEEGDHAMLLFPMEGNLLKTHRKNPASNSRRLREAIALALFDVKARYTGEEILVERFRDENNAKLENALLMAFDPFTNEEVYEVVTGGMGIDLEDLDALRSYYAEPVLCMLRIKESVDTMEKRLGANGYFDFIEGYMGEQIVGDEMKFSIFIGSEKIRKEP